MAGDNSLRAALASAAAHLRAGELYNVCTGSAVGKGCRRGQEAHRAGKGFCTEGLPSAGSFLYGQPLPQEDW